MTSRINGVVLWAVLCAGCSGTLISGSPEPGVGQPGDLAAVQGEVSPTGAALPAASNGSPSPADDGQLPGDPPATDPPPTDPPAGPTDPPPTDPPAGPTDPPPTAPPPTDPPAPPPPPPTSWPGVGACNPAPCQMLFMSPTGNDQASGLTPADAVRSIARIAAILTATPYHQSQHVEVRIAQGLYDNYDGKNRVNWDPSLSSSSYTITFLPIDYTAGSGATPVRPVFDGSTSASCAAPSNCAPQGYFFYHDAGTTRPTNLRFYYLQVQDYGSGGLAFVHADGNTVHGNIFSRIGNKWTNDGSYVSYAAVALHWSSNNFVNHNDFLNIEARGGSCGSGTNVCTDCRACLHALYLAHGANNNDLTYNRVEVVSGDPLRVRDNSNENTFSYYSRIAQAGKQAFYSEWYNPDVGECPSWENRFQHNADLSCGYLGETFDKSWCYSRRNVVCEDGTYIPSHCTKPTPTAVRLRTYQNDTALCP